MGNSLRQRMSSWDMPRRSIAHSAWFQIMTSDFMAPCRRAAARFIRCSPRKWWTMRLRVIESLADSEHRDREMGRCRVILQIRASDKLGLVSSSRCATALHLGRPVVAEPHKLDGHWKDVVHFSKSLDDFVSDAIKVRAFWQSYHDKQLAQFRKLFSPERCIGEGLSLLKLSGQNLGQSHMRIARYFSVLLSNYPLPLRPKCPLRPPSCSQPNIHFLSLVLLMTCVFSPPLFVTVLATFLLSFLPLLCHFLSRPAG